MSYSSNPDNDAKTKQLLKSIENTRLENVKLLNPISLYKNKTMCVCLAVLCTLKYAVYFFCKTLKFLWSKDDNTIKAKLSNKTLGQTNINTYRMSELDIPGSWEAEF